MSNIPNITILTVDPNEATITIQVSPIDAVARIEEYLSRRSSLIEWTPDYQTGQITLRHVGVWMIWTPQKRLESLRAIIDQINDSLSKTDDDTQ